MEPDISNMTLNEYLMYQRGHKGLERSCTSSKSVAPPCATLKPVHHNNHSEVDIESMTLEKYVRYELTMSTMKNEMQVPTQCFTSQFFHQSQYAPKPSLDEEDSSFDEILDDLFRIRAENIRNMEYEVPNRCDDITNYEDSNQKDGEFPDLPTFSATNKFASVYEQGEDNIDVNTAHELEEVQVEDVEMDEDYDIDHSNTEEAIHLSPA
nr:hypothetical protein [Tanacetum cinerariifolium]